MTKKSQMEAIKRYKKKKKRYQFDLDKEADRELIEFLEGRKAQPFFKALLKAIVEAGKQRL